MPAIRNYSANSYDKDPIGPNPLKPTYLYEKNCIIIWSEANTQTITTLLLKDHFEWTGHGIFEFSSLELGPFKLQSSKPCWWYEKLSQGCNILGRYCLLKNHGDGVKILRKFPEPSVPVILDHGAKVRKFKCRRSGGSVLLLTYPCSLVYSRHCDGQKYGSQKRGEIEMRTTTNGDNRTTVCLNLDDERGAAPKPSQIPKFTALSAPIHCHR